MDNIEKKNTVESKNQVKKKVLFEGFENGTPKIMFVGNSITLHNPAPQIGWYGSWGMAASSKEKDYVHLCINHVKSKYPKASFCIVQASEWERGYKDIDFEEFFSEAKIFNPDIIITRLSENIPPDYLEHDSFITSMNEFHSYLSGNNVQTKHIVTSNVFGSKIKDEALEDYSKQFDAVYVYLNDYKKDEQNLAHEFEHSGVRMHPGDKGMKFIAERIISALDMVLSEQMLMQFPMKKNKER